MKFGSIGFIGGGRITRIFLGGWKRAGAMPENIIVGDPNAETLAKLKVDFPGITAVGGDNRRAAAQPVVVLAVHPPVMMAALRDLLAPLGECPEVAEPKLEAYALITGMGPTYLWFQFEALRELGRTFGLDDADLAPALKRMVCGAARALLESGLSPAGVMDLIPVKPLAEDEAAIRDCYQRRLLPLFEKIKP